MEDPVMARAVYQHELQDPDFSWLVNRFQELNPQYLLIETTVQPLVFIRREAQGTARIDDDAITTVPSNSETFPFAKRS